MSVLVRRLIIATLLYFGVCLITSIVIKPFSIINFIGPAAGISSALTIIWGVPVLISVLFGTLFFSSALMLLFGVQMDLAVALISLLAICLQSFWTKQLTYKSVRQQNWLKSRALLLSFILKLGPLAGVVSAFAAVIVSVIHTQSQEGSIFYIFITTWSASMLSAVFFTPIFLFTQGVQQLSLTKRWFVMIASVLGAIAIGLLFKISQNDHQHQRLDQFNQAKNEVHESLEDEVGMIKAHLNGLSAFFNASDHVSLKEFNIFSSHIFKENSSIRALEWIPIVKKENRELFEKHASDVLNIPYFIKEQFKSGDVGKALPKDVHTPVFYVYPQLKNEQAIGLDLYANKDKFLAMRKAALQNKPSASSPLTLVQDDYSNPGLLIFNPVYSTKSLNPFGALEIKDQPLLIGYVLAVVQFEHFFNQVSHALESNNVSIFVQDVAATDSYILFGNPLAESNRLVHTLETSAFDRQWTIMIAEKEPWIMQSKQWQTWSMVIGGTFGGLLFQLLILMMAAYSTELTHQVVLKTRELILSKELSEQESSAKTHFLQTLSIELRTPINAIKSLMKEFKQKEGTRAADRVIKDMSIASSNLTQLVDTLFDLTNIESGNIILQNKTFDFIGFLNRIEIMLNASGKTSGYDINFLINKDVPHFIESDELRLQQLFIALTENAVKLLSSHDLRLSVKAHVHKLQSATLFLVFIPLTSSNSSSSSSDGSMSLKEHSTKDLGLYGTSMKMAKEICQMLDGDVKLTLLPSGEAVLTASIKVEITSVFQQRKFQTHSIEKDNENQIN